MEILSDFTLKRWIVETGIPHGYSGENPPALAVGSVNYDPHDAESVQAAETWRKALFSGVTQFKAVEPVAVKVGDIAPFGDEYRRQKDELKKASAPLVEYLKRYGDPHTTITVTRDSAAERQDERGVTFDSEKPAETVKRGHWEKSDIPCEKYVCSVCGGACWYYDCGGDVAKSRFCPNCGARMENALGNGGNWLEKDSDIV